MVWIRLTLRSSIGMKGVMAISGLLLVGFVIAHMLGNLLIYFGPDALNSYAAALRRNPGLLWTARAALVAVFIVHIGVALRLSAQNRAARPEPYSCDATVVATYASRSMLLSGGLVFLYVLYHLAHFTFHAVHRGEYPVTDEQGRPNVFAMVVHGFQQPLVSGIYIAATLVLGVHLSHGIASLFQSLGINHPRYNRSIDRFGAALSAALVIGNVSMPLAVLAGLIG
jgi:succinate dehydrogenase / fumarate reductase cytochrome b subunit